MLEVDLDAWRRMNLSRPPEELIREAIQNILDEEPTEIQLDLMQRADGRIWFRVADNCKEGVRDLNTLWTLFSTDKRQKPTCRGRMGRGLKELIIVGDRVEIMTVQGTIVFDVLKKERRKDESKCTKQGTQIEMIISKWDSSVIKKITEWCRRLILPEEVKFTVCGEVIPQRKLLEHYEDFKLKTVVYEEDLRERELLRPTEVVLYEKLLEDAYIYEMGIPVDILPEFPYDVDVQQRIPIPPQRNHIRDSYKKRLYRQLLEARAHKMTDAESKADYIGQVIGEAAPEVQDTLIKKRYGADTVIGTHLNHQQNVISQERGARVIVTSHLSEGWRKAFKKRRPTAKKFVEEVLTGDPDLLGRLAQPGWKPKITYYVDLPKRDKLVCDWVQWFATKLEPKFSWEIAVVENVHPMSDRLADVSINDNHGRIRLFRKRLEPHCKFFSETPMTEKGLSIVIHEVGHVVPFNHTQQFFKHVERLAGKAALIMLSKQSEIKRKFKALLP